MTAQRPVWSLTMMYVCYLHTDVWKEELAAEFVVYVMTPGLRLDQGH